VLVRQEGDVQLHAAEMRIVEVRHGRDGDGALEARVQLRLAVGDTGPPSGYLPDWVRLRLDKATDWEEAAVLRGNRLRESRH